MVKRYTCVVEGCDKEIESPLRGRRRKRCDACADEQQKKNTKRARQIRNIKKRTKVLWTKILQSYDKADIKKLSIELDKLQEIKWERLKELHLDKVNSKGKEVQELMIKQPKDTAKLEKAQAELKKIVNTPLESYDKERWK